MTQYQDDPAWIARHQQQYAATELMQERLRQTGRRAADSETARAAAVQDAGQALADYRQQLRELLPADEAESWRMDAEDLANLAGLPLAELRRALEAADTTHSTAGPIAGWTDRALATTLHGYGYDHEAAATELHRRYPHLLGILAAHRAISGAADEALEAATGELVWQIDEIPAPSPQELLVRDLYRSHVDAIADGRPLPR
ncbi:hypothetical protein ACIQF6_28220 [Kitasatospora sp. NPDC092948]|uniref:hypothetical protein n=1 Tax=Kitasatospora sp. NPDC092948 TaxID=3364088 RepID=UPI00382A5394